SLLVGNTSRTDVRKVMKPGPPNQFGLPPEPKMELVHEEYLYAKLKGNDQLFEIKADKLKDLAPGPSAVRDPQLARFKAGDVQRLEIQAGDKKIVLAKEKD